MNKTIEFEIICEENPQIHQKGYVEVPEDENEFADYYYEDDNGFALPKLHTIHDGAGWKITEEERAEVEAFERLVAVEGIHLDFLIETSEEDDRCTYSHKGIEIRINGGEEE